MTIYISALLQSLKASPAYRYPVQQVCPIPLSAKSATTH